MSEMKSNEELAAGSPEAEDASEANAEDAPVATEEAAAAPQEAHEASQEEKEPDLLPRGNPLRRRAIITMLAGGLPGFLLMAKNGQNSWGVPAGLLCMLVLTWGIMDFLGTFDDADEHVASSATLAVITKPLVLTVVAFGAFCAFLAVGQSAMFPWWFGSITVTASFLALVAAILLC